MREMIREKKDLSVLKERLKMIKYARDLNAKIRGLNSTQDYVNYYIGRYALSTSPQYGEKRNDNKRVFQNRYFIRNKNGKCGLCGLYFPGVWNEELELHKADPQYQILSICQVTKVCTKCQQYFDAFAEEMKIEKTCICCGGERVRNRKLQEMMKNYRAIESLLKMKRKTNDADTISLRGSRKKKERK